MAGWTFIQDGGWYADTDANRAGQGRFPAIVPDDPSVVIKPMFGNLGAFVDGNMFAGLFGSMIGVRLVDDASRRELEVVEGTGPFGPAERPMGGYVALPAAWSADPERSAPWIEIAPAQVRALPPNTAKPKATKRSPLTCVASRIPGGRVPPFSGDRTW